MKLFTLHHLQQQQPVSAGIPLQVRVFVQVLLPRAPPQLQRQPPKQAQLQAQLQVSALVLFQQWFLELLELLQLVSAFHNLFKNDAPILTHAIDK